MYKLIVKCFGSFEVNIDDTQVVAPNSRNTQAIFLLAYLLSCRKRKVGQEELIEVLQISEDSGNPYGVLKNTVYRLRKMFDSVGAVGDKIVLYSKNCYYLSEDLIFDIDKEKFEELISAAYDKEKTSDERIEMLLSALDIYRGEYLPRLSSEMWVITQSVSLQGLYLKSLNAVWELCQNNEQYVKMLSYLDKTVSLYPYEESAAAIRIMCLTKLGKFEEANEFYIDFSNMLANELGISVGSELTKAYADLSNVTYTENDSIARIRDEVLNQKYESGALFCDINSFISTYRFVIRNMERNSQSVYLMLCTLYNSDGSLLKRGDIAKKACENFYLAAGRSMRRGDIYTRYSPSQFLSMISGLTQEDCNIVMKRIENNFIKLYSKKDVILKCQILPAIDLNSLNVLTCGAVSN